MAFDLNQFVNQRNQELNDQIAQLQPLTKPQGGVLNQIDPTWLALAQGFLAPTKTGGFGESLGNAAAQLQGPLAKMKEQQMSAMDKINALKQAQMKMQLDAYKAQNNGGDDSSLELYRDLRNEDLINRRYDRQITSLDKIINDQFADEAKVAEAKAKKEALEAERDEKLQSSGFGGKKKQPVQAGQPQASQPQQPQGDMKSHPDVKAAVKMYNERKGSVNPAQLPVIKKQIVERLNQNGIRVDESIFAD
jgi:hypothetical protein